MDKKEQEEQQKEMDQAMEKLHEFEKEIGFNFVPLVHYTNKGSFTYIAPVKKEETKEE